MIQNFLIRQYSKNNFQKKSPRRISYKGKTFEKNNMVSNDSKSSNKGDKEFKTQIKI